MPVSARRHRTRAARALKTDRTQGRIRRMRVIAGPNGSGKSTLLTRIKPQWRGVYINADDIERQIRSSGHLNLADYALSATAVAELPRYLAESALLQRAGLVASVHALRIEDRRLLWGTSPVNAYHAAVLADFIRQALLVADISFTFETVMSSPDKVTLMERAHALGWRTYLYFVATEDPLINLKRVQQRVALGGHDVPRDKLMERYTRSIALLERACTAADRAYVFDNSGPAHELIAEICNGEELTLHSPSLPGWLERSSLWQAFQG